MSRLIEVGYLIDVQPGQLRLVDVEGEPVVLVNDAGRLLAIQGTCTHEDWGLEDGFVDSGAIACSLHGSRFDIRTGEVLDPPADTPLRTYRVELDGDRVLVEVP